jgi:hypothetical protein
MTFDPLRTTPGPGTLIAPWHLPAEQQTDTPADPQEQGA